MRTTFALLAALAVAGGLAWYLLAAGEAPAPVPGPRAGREDRTEPERDPSRAAPLPPLRTSEPAPPAPEPEDPEWIAVPLPLPAGVGALKGSDLIAAVESAGKVRFRGATEGDLEALRRAVLEDVDRTVDHPHAAMMGWLKEAGFEVEVAWPSLVVRRRTDDDWTGR